jgi:hypothetical protein
MNMRSPKAWVVAGALGVAAAGAGLAVTTGWEPA